MKTTMEFKGRKIEISLTTGNILLAESLVLTEIGTRNSDQMLLFIAWAMYSMGLDMKGNEIYMHNVCGI